MSASGCCSKWSARDRSRLVICRLSSAMIPTAATVVAANASTIGSGACELLGAQRGLDVVRAPFEVASPASRVTVPR